MRFPAGINCDGEMFFRTTGKALYSLITRHPDDKSDSVEVAREALRRASILGEPIRIQQRLTRYYNKYLVIAVRITIGSSFYTLCVEGS
jgi:hypothetical protein